jgi:AcrR family transcriptional regulator
MPGSRVAEAKPRNRPGRPRSEESRAAVLRATSQLLREVGLRAMTTEEIASRSGASKATIYKWWPNKYAVAFDAFLSEMTAESHDPDTGSARDDLIAVVRGLLRFYTGPSGRVFAQLVGEAQTDPEIQRELRANLVDSRRRIFRSIWERGVERGEFRADTDPDAAIDVAIGPALYRLMMGHAPMTDEAADALVDVAVRGLARSD